jgi:hypothetical protein
MLVQRSQTLIYIKHCRCGANWQNSCIHNKAQRSQLLLYYSITWRRRASKTAVETAGVETIEKPAPSAIPVTEFEET